MAKVVLITGASTGLGEAIATYLAKKGFVVYGTSRSIEEGTQTFATLKMDVGSEESVQAAVAHIIQQQGRIDVLINNAGLGIAGPIEYLAIDAIQKVLDTNLLGVVRTSQAVLSFMRQQGNGLIINISSIASEAGLPYRGIYSASKAALDRLTEALRIELAPFNVQACYVQPGGIKTDINKNRITAPLAANNVYKESFNRTYQLVNDSVSGGLDTAIFARAIEKIINSKKVKRCYRIGKPLEKLSVLLKRLLPDAVHERMLSKHYKV